MAARKAKDPLEYLSWQVQRDIGKDKAMLTRMENITGEPYSIAIKSSKGDDYTVTGLDRNAVDWDKKTSRTVMRPGEDPVHAAASLAAQSGPFGGQPGKPNEAAMADIEAQLLNHPALKDRTLEERAALLTQVHDMTSYRGNISKDVMKRGMSVLAEDPKKVEVLRQAGVIDEKQAKLLTGEALAADELDAEQAGIPWAGMQQWLKDMPVQQHLIGLGAASAGVGAGSIAVANMLSQQGQQQTDFNAYAQAAQSMNAY